MTGYFDKGNLYAREQLLADMERVMPWARLMAKIEPYYPKGEGGRPPLPLARMLRLYLLQQWYNLPIRPPRRRCTTRRRCAALPG